MSSFVLAERRTSLASETPVSDVCEQFAWSPGTLKYRFLSLTSDDARVSRTSIVIMVVFDHKWFLCLHASMQYHCWTEYYHWELLYPITCTLQADTQSMHCSTHTIMTTLYFCHYVIYTRSSLSEINRTCKMAAPIVQQFWTNNVKLILKQYNIFKQTDAFQLFFL